jgi:hypothetical protein
LRKANSEGNADADSEMCSAVAKAFENSTLETLYLPDDEINCPSRTGIRDARATDVLKASLYYCSISLEAFECSLARLSTIRHWSQVERYQHDRRLCYCSLVDGLRTNKTLKYLDLSLMMTLSQSGRAAIEQLIVQCLERAQINSDSVGASILAAAFLTIKP